MRLFFLKKRESNKHFWNLNLKLSRFCRKALGNILNCSFACPEVYFEYFFFEELQYNIFSEWSVYFRNFDLQVSTNCLKIVLTVLEKIWKFLFLWKKPICVRTLELEHELSGHSVKKVILAVKTALYVSWGTLWGVFVEWKKTFVSLSNPEKKGFGLLQFKNANVVRTPFNESKTTFSNFFMEELNSQIFFRILSETDSDR